MKFSIFEFSQEEVIKFPELNLTDLLLLQYIKDAIASPTMQHKIDDSGNCYVWLYHEKILQDLPILQIGESMLKKHLKKLIDVGMIKSLKQADAEKRGTKSFYTITEECENLYVKRPSVKNYTCLDDQVEKITLDKARPSVKNYPSNKQLVKKDNLLKNSNIRENFELKGVKPKKENLYSKCVADIDSRNYSKDLHDALVDYLQVRLQMKDKPLYANSWKGLLNKLERDFKEDERIGVVFQSIERGYASFFPVNRGFNKQSNNQLDKPWERGVTCEKMTKEEEAQHEKWLSEQRAKGVKVDF